jgi:outer membrane protein, heavy metal efflux system
MVRWIGFVLAPLVLAGCVTTSMEDEFAELEAEVRGRSGYDVDWVSVTDAQEAVSSRVAALMEDSLTADEAVQVALLNNRQLQAMYARMGIQVGHFIQAGLLPNPVVDANMKLRNDQRLIEGAVVYNFLELLLIPLRKRLEGAQLEALQARVTADVIDLAAETRIAFWDYVAARQHLALSEDVLSAALARYRMASQLRAAGNEPLLLFYEEREHFEHAKLDVAEAQMKMLENREQLNALMGLWGHGVMWETPSRLPALPEEELDLANIEARAIEASLDISVELYDLMASAQQLGIRRVTSVIPEFKAGIAAEREPSENIELVKREYASETEYKLKESQGPDNWWAGPMVSVEVPIFDQNQGRRAAARMEIRRRWEEIGGLATDIRAAARLAAYRLEYTRKRAQFFNEVLVPVRHQIVLQTHLQYNAMFKGVFDLVAAKQMEINTSREYIENLRHYWIARTQAEQLLMGRLYDTELRRSSGIDGSKNERMQNDGGH